MVVPTPNPADCQLAWRPNSDMDLNARHRSTTTVMPALLMPVHDPKTRIRRRLWWQWTMADEQPRRKHLVRISVLVLRPIADAPGRIADVLQTAVPDGEVWPSTSAWYRSCCPAATPSAPLASSRTLEHVSTTHVGELSRTTALCQRSTSLRRHKVILLTEGTRYIYRLPCVNRAPTNNGGRTCGRRSASASTTARRRITAIGPHQVRPVK